MKLRKVLSLLLIACLLFAYVPKADAAEIASGTCGDDLTWVLDDAGVLTISGTGSMNNYTYSDPAPWFSAMRTVTAIVLNPGITSIGNYAFYQCSMPTEVIIPQGVTRIGTCAFSYCSELEVLELPESLTAVGNSAFSYCIGLTDITIPESVTSIGDNAFLHCAGLTEVTVPGGVTYIGSNVFRNCTGLTKVTISEGIDTIADSMFSGCIRLTDVSIPRTVTCIENAAFIACSALTELTIPNGVTTIETSAFSGCTKLASITFPDSVAYIGYGAFEDCFDLTSIVIPAGVTEIGNYTFRNCYNLTSITIPDSVTSICAGAFYYCSGLTGITIPEAVTEIGYGAFYYCQDLTGITIPGNVTSIGEYAFNQCTEMQTVTFTGNLPVLAENAFSGVTATAYYPAGNDTWTEDALRDYGGTLTWEAAGGERLAITAQPVGQKVKAGTNAQFSVEATGTGLQYQWQYRTSSSGWLNCTAAGNKTATMTVAATCAKSTYRYRCVITDAAGNTVTTKTVYLYVLGVKTQPVGQKVIAGDAATFSVSATGHQKTYQWQYRTSASGAWLNCSAAGNQTATMKVPATCAKSGYQYRCMIKDSAGNVVYTKTVYLYVLGIKTQPANRTVSAGTNATFKVVATGHMKTYQWQYSVDGGVTWKNATASGNKSATLTVPGTASRNGYLYRCKITDSVGNVIYTNPAKLTVK